MLAFLKQMFKIVVSKTDEELVKTKRKNRWLKKEVWNLGLNVMIAQGIQQMKTQLW